MTVAEDMTRSICEDRLNLSVGLQLSPHLRDMSVDLGMLDQLHPAPNPRPMVYIRHTSPLLYHPLLKDTNIRFRIKI